MNPRRDGKEIPQNNILRGFSGIDFERAAKNGSTQGVTIPQAISSVAVGVRATAATTNGQWLLSDFIEFSVDFCKFDAQSSDLIYYFKLVAFCDNWRDCSRRGARDLGQIRRGADSMRYADGYYEIKDEMKREGRCKFRNPKEKEVFCAIWWCGGMKEGLDWNGNGSRFDSCCVELEPEADAPYLTHSLAMENAKRFRTERIRVSADRGTNGNGSMRTKPQHYASC
ncbi:hypothetical protein RRG08_013057 [Elysia crispata]|uniref:Uncharacterized protein n=1 Tax=Elysia crispata TaxID=231223 RepID=A0AAE1A0P2_9GAST|nr:hypothetical protein RRG08_013057 [Elysia crispata]